MGFGIPFRPGSAYSSYLRRIESEPKGRRGSIDGVGFLPWPGLTAIVLSTCELYLEAHETSIKCCGKVGLE